MGRIVVTEFVSLDGVMEDPGGAEDFKYGGWTFEINRGDEGDKFKLDETMASDALLLGRRTYEGFAAAWPSLEGDFADRFNSMPIAAVMLDLGFPAATVKAVPILARTASLLAHLAEEREQPIGFLLAAKAEEAIRYEP